MFNFTFVTVSNRRKLTSTITTTNARYRATVYCALRAQHTAERTQCCGNYSSCDWALKKVTVGCINNSSLNRQKLTHYVQCTCAFGPWACILSNIYRTEGNEFNTCSRATSTESLNVFWGPGLFMLIKLQWHNSYELYLDVILCMIHVQGLNAHVCFLAQQLGLLSDT